MSDATDDTGFVMVCEGHDFIATSSPGIRGMFYGEGVEPAKPDWSTVVPRSDGPGAVIVTEEPTPHEHNFLERRAVEFIDKLLRAGEWYISAIELGLGENGEDLKFEAYEIVKEAFGKGI